VIERTEHSNAKHGVLTKLGQHVTALGFDPKPADQSFYRSSATGKWAFHVAFIPHQQDFDLTADVAVRIDAIEDLVNQCDTKLSKVERRRSMTLGVELGNLSLGRQMRWTIASSSDIPKICEQVATTFESVGLPFLQNYSDLATVHRVLASASTKDTLLSPLLGPRSMRTLASAYLLDQSIDIKAVAHDLEAKLMESEDLYLEDFRALGLWLLGKQGTSRVG
jgi:hypothetical protein